jgi:hypothetical protein
MSRKRYIAYQTAQERKNLRLAAAFSLACGILGATGTCCGMGRYLSSDGPQAPSATTEELLKKAYGVGGFVVAFAFATTFGIRRFEGRQMRESAEARTALEERNNGPTPPALH